MNPTIRTYNLQALTDVWTGGVNPRKCNATKNTGLIGSIRWWFEVLVRGLDGSPCDPSANQKSCIDDKHCVVCELFGCTGWARKFRFDVCNDKEAVIQSKLEKNMEFRLRFTPLRSVYPEEWALLELTLRLISDFGALGGKTVLKPSSQNNKPQHADFGLVRWTGSVSQSHTREQLAQYVHAWAKKPTVDGANWASCSHMWFVDGQRLTRQDQKTSTFNRVLGRPEPKSSAANGGSDSWRAGSRGVSKKVFSFQSPARTFGFVEQPRELDGVRDELRSIWKQPAANDWFVSGDALVSRLFSQAGGA